MGILRFQFLRSLRAGEGAQRAAPSDGLDAFASEQGSAAPDASTIQDPTRGYVWATGMLMVAVLLEAYPTTLWLIDRFQPVAAEAFEAPPAPATTPPALAALPPCEATSPQTVIAEPRAVEAAAKSSTARAAEASSAAANRGMLAGVVAVTAPVPMRVFERGRLIGSTEAESMLLAVGNHDLEFVNESVGYRVRRAVNVQAGQKSTLQLEAPLGTLHVNAIPWAEVWIDNERVGETPVGNLRTRIGNREVVFRHPELGERRATVLVTLIGPARISMDLRNK